MFRGSIINQTEKRQVLHTLLRAQQGDTITTLGENQQLFTEVEQVRQRIFEFSDKIRQGEIVGITGKPLKNTLCIGIGGSYLGPEFVAETFKTIPELQANSLTRNLRFLANVDPVDFLRCTQGLDASETLVVIISKTFTTAETMMNANRVRQWLLSELQGNDEAEIIRNHMCAVSTALNLTSNFGINSERVFGFWDWVGGRFSVTSAVGVLPLSLQFGSEAVQQFLLGAASIDKHFYDNANPDNWKQNIPLLLGLIGWWNTEALQLSTRAILPYSQALLRFAAHVQQLDMESNGKQCRLDGSSIETTGPIVFGEPGTNGQHSFYQLMHQGRVVPAEFIGFCRSHSSDAQAHNELMCNFFAQQEALALGKAREQLEAENCPEELIPHKLFSGDRPSLSLLFKQLTAYECGQLLAIYEHRVATEGFIWGINSFDQFGVELGKGLANNLRNNFSRAEFRQEIESDATKRSLAFYIDNK